MKIKEITLKNYKRFVEPTTFSFVDLDGDINEKTLIIGTNGTGKSSLLQAIVILLASAIRDNFNPDTLNWSGFEYRRLQSGSSPISIEATILFDEEEIEATENYLNQIEDKEEVRLAINIPNLRKSSQPNELTIYLDYPNNKILIKEDEIFDNYGTAFKGFEYAQKLAKITKNKTHLFDKVGNIYWYTEERKSNHITNLSSNENKKVELDDVRNFLASAYYHHISITQGAELQEGEFDFYEKLEATYKKAFPDRSFVGSKPRFDIYEAAKVPDFFLHDGKNQYEIGEMSGAERVIFPILMDFVRWNINHSIIIIDEVELHLHPPLQQGLIRILSRLGHDNQFIFTSHSDTVMTMFHNTEIKRLQND